jgi:hypothetical protein
MFFVGGSIGCESTAVDPTPGVTAAAPLPATLPARRPTTQVAVPVVRRDSYFAGTLSAKQTARVVAAAERARPDGRPTWFVYVHSNYKPLLGSPEFRASVFYAPDNVEGRIRRGRRLTVTGDGDDDRNVGLYEYVQVLRPGQPAEVTGPPGLRDLPMFLRAGQEATLLLGDAEIVSLVDFARAAFEKSSSRRDGDEFIKSIRRLNHVYEIETEVGLASGRILRVKRQADRWVQDGNIGIWRS